MRLCEGKSERGKKFAEQGPSGGKLMRGEIPNEIMSSRKGKEVSAKPIGSQNCTVQYWIHGGWDVGGRCTCTVLYLHNNTLRRGTAWPTGSCAIRIWTQRESLGDVK